MPDNRVISARFPYLPLTLAIRERSVDVEALLDTGFDGYVALPTSLLGDDAPPDARIQYVLADGSVVTAPVYRGIVSVGSLGRIRAGVTVIGDEPIVGRQVTDQFRVTLDHGHQVILEA